MNDITKAKYFLKAHGSKLESLETFGLMLATARDKHRELRLEKSSSMATEVVAIRGEGRALRSLIDLAVLTYLKKFAQLPTNVADILSPGIDDEAKHDLAHTWIAQAR